MNKLIYVLIFVLFALTIIFSYKVRDYRLFDISKDEKKEVIDVVSKPIVFDAQRKFLTALYREKHTGDCDHRRDGLDACVNIKPKIIVLHMTDLDTLKKSFAYMKEPVLREERNRLVGRSYDRLNVSTHYLIDKDGTIYSLMPDNHMARHAMGVNHIAIGIENVGFNSLGPSVEQVDSNVRLVTYLMKRYDMDVENIFSHSEIGMLKGRDFFIEKSDNYFRDKSCGEKVVREVRRRLGYEG